MRLFYNAKDLDINQRKQILSDAYSVKTVFSFEILDLNLSYFRRATSYTFDEGIKLFDETCHFVVIYDDLNDHGEIGFCTLGGSHEYHMFIYTHKDEFDKIILKHRLEIMQ